MLRTFTSGESVTPLLQSRKQSHKRSNAWALLLLFGVLFSALFVVGLLKTSGRFEQLSETFVGSRTGELDDVAVGEPEEIAVGTPWSADALGPCAGVSFGRCKYASVWNDLKERGDRMWIVCHYSGLLSGTASCAIQINNDWTVANKVTFVTFNASPLPFTIDPQQSSPILSAVDENGGTGLKIGMRITRINDKDVKGLGLDAAGVNNLLAAPTFPMKIGFSYANVLATPGYGAACQKEVEGTWVDRQEGDDLWGEMKMTFTPDGSLIATSVDLAQDKVQPCDEFRTSYVDNMLNKLGADKIEKMSNWMAGLDSSTSILNVKIPGTHDSGTYAATQPWSALPLGDAHAKSTTQDVDISRSLKAGIRAVDLRIASYNINKVMCSSKVGLGHGFFGSNLCLEDVFEQIKEFLRLNRNEIVLVNVQLEGKNGAPGLQDHDAMKSALDEIHKFALDTNYNGPHPVLAARKITESNGKPTQGSVHTLQALRDAHTRIILTTEEFGKDATVPDTATDLISGVIDKYCGTISNCKYQQIKEYLWDQYGWYANKNSAQKVLKHMKKQAVKFENKQTFDHPTPDQTYGKLKQTSAGSVGREGRLFNQNYQISPTVGRLNSLWRWDISEWKVATDRGKLICESFKQPISDDGRMLYSSMNVVRFDFVGTKMYPLWYFINLQLPLSARIELPERLDYTNPIDWLPPNAKSQHNKDEYFGAAIVERPGECTTTTPDKECAAGSTDGCERKDFNQPTQPV